MRNFTKKKIALQATVTYLFILEHGLDSYGIAILSPDLLGSYYYQKMVGSVPDIVADLVGSAGLPSFMLASSRLIIDDSLLYRAHEGVVEEVCLCLSSKLRRRCSKI